MQPKAQLSKRVSIYMYMYVVMYFFLGPGEKVLVNSCRDSLLPSLVNSATDYINADGLHVV